MAKYSANKKRIFEIVFVGIASESFGTRDIGHSERFEATRKQAQAQLLRELKRVMANEAYTGGAYLREIKRL